MELSKQAKRMAARRGYLLSRYTSRHRAQWLKEVDAVKRERILLLDHGEACQILSAVEATARIPGDLAELGVASGASARLIAKHAGERTLHLFDTFEGLPAPETGDSAKFAAGDFRNHLEDVRKYLAGLNCRFYKGLFPATAAPVANLQFSFVHLDVDLYESTRAGLEFFYPRMSRGGIIISHDYLSADGVDRAVAEFFADKPEPVIEMVGGYQCLVVKL